MWSSRAKDAASGPFHLRVVQLQQVGCDLCDGGCKKARGKIWAVLEPRRQRDVRSCANVAQFRRSTVDVKDTTQPCPNITGEYAVALLVQAMRYETESCAVDSRWGLWRFFHPSGRTMALRSIQPLGEMSIRDLSWDIRAAGAQGWQRCHLHVPTATDACSPMSLSRLVIG
jgi:hypothetical protein